MSIETVCNCGKRLRVADEHAGKKARCPQCGAVYVVPEKAGAASAVVETPESTAGETTETSPLEPATPQSAATQSTWGNGDSPAASEEAASETVPIQPSTSTTGSDVGSASQPGNTPDPSQPSRSPSGDPQWMFRSENGQIYGPVTRRQLMQWASEGRVSAECQLQLVGGDGRWEPVTGWLDRRQLGGPAAAAATQVNVAPSYNGVTSYDAGYSPMSSIGHARPHRGGLVLFLGLLGIGCPIFSAMAWALGYRDLAEIDAGRMDPRGRGLTSTGMVLGIIMVTIQTLIFLAMLLD